MNMILGIAYMIIAGLSCFYGILTCNDTKNGAFKVNYGMIIGLLMFAISPIILKLLKLI